MGGRSPLALLALMALMPLPVTTVTILLPAATSVDALWLDMATGLCLR